MQTQPATTRTHRADDRPHRWPSALLVFVTVLLVLFVMFNTQTVDISLVFTDVEAPLVLALLIAAVLGGLVVALAGALRAARRRRPDPRFRGLALRVLQLQERENHPERRRVPDGACTCSVPTGR